MLVHVHVWVLLAAILVIHHDLHRVDVALQSDMKAMFDNIPNGEYHPQRRGSTYYPYLPSWQTTCLNSL